MHIVNETCSIEILTGAVRDMYNAHLGSCHKSRAAAKWNNVSCPWHSLLHSIVLLHDPWGACGGRAVLVLLRNLPGYDPKGKPVTPK